MGFSYRWDDDAHTVMRYSAEGDWNWNDYHKAVRMSMFEFTRLGQGVISLVDLRGGSKIPAGAVGHIRSMAKKVSPAQAGRAIIIGLDSDIEQKVGAVNREFRHDEQLIRFVDSDEDAYAVIKAWRSQK